MGSIKNDPHFFERVITGDECWVFEYDPETKRQSMEWHTATSPRPKKARMSKSKIKCMLICFFDRHGIVHKEFVPQGRTVNQHFYRKVLKKSLSSATKHQNELGAASRQRAISYCNLNNGVFSQ